MMYSAMLAENGPYIIRYPRGYGEGVDWKGHEYTALGSGKGEILLEGDNVAVICAGPSANRAMEAAAAIKEAKGWNPSVYNIRYIKPLDTELIDKICQSHQSIITVEDGTIIGGLRGAVAEYVSAKWPAIKVIPVGIPDRYISQGTQSELREECGLTTACLNDTILAEYSGIR